MLAFTECQKSILNVKHGTRCPKDVASWHMAASKMNCDSMQQECSKSLGLDPQRFIFQYHCLINSWMNATVEVCALNRSILGKCKVFLLEKSYFLNFLYQYRKYNYGVSLITIVLGMLEIIQCN